MTQDQDNIRTMFTTTLDYLDTNNSVWSARPAFADAVTRAKAAVAAIDGAVGKQQTPTTGVTGDKAELRNDLEEKLLELADQLAAFAARSGNHDLAAQVEMTKSSLDRQPENDLVQTAERIAGLATTNMAALADFEVTPAEVTALNNARSAFRDEQNAPRNMTAERSAQTQSLPQLIATARSIFRNELDKMMTRFKQSNADFYNGYFAARVIVDRAATHKTKPAPTPGPAKPNP